MKACLGKYALAGRSNLMAPTEPRGNRELAKQLHAASRGMGEVYVQWLDLNRLPASPVRDALLVALVRAYAKPFVPSGSGGPTPTLDVGALGLFEGRADLEQLHRVLTDDHHFALANPEKNEDVRERSDADGSRLRRKRRSLDEVDLLLLSTLIRHVAECTNGLAADLDLAYLVANGL